MHVDTGHNFPEVIEFRDRRVAELGVRLVVASVQESIDAGRVAEETGRWASRNRLQTVTLLDAIEEHRFDAVFGGARRDEEKARAKERVFSFRDEFGQWDPKNQRPELWSIYNARIQLGEHIRVFPLSNWTELDVWQYIAAGEPGDPVDLLRPRRAGVRARRDAAGRRPRTSRAPTTSRCSRPRVRYRTVGDMTCTGAVESAAATLEEVIAEIAATRITERGADPRRRPHQRGRHGGPQEGGVLLMPDAPEGTPVASPWPRDRHDRHAAARHGRLGGRRQEHPHRAAAVRLQGDLRGPARAVERTSRASAARTTPTSPC